MMHELLINEQQVDLGDLNIVLEYTNNVAGDIGKINLSHSYTVKIPKTARNAKILDNPGQPAHESGYIRRFLSARFYRNGIDLIGDAQAYILKTTPEAYEIALVWNTLEALQVLSQSDATINDLPDLPTLTWIGSNGRTPDYNGGMDGALFAWYESGLGAATYPNVNAGTHPCIKLSRLITGILDNAGVPFVLSDGTQAKLANMVILAAPGHKPSRLQEAESGVVANSVYLRAATINNKPGTMLYIMDKAYGWDAPNGETGDNDTHRVLINLQAPGSVDLSNCRFVVQGYTTGTGVNENVVQDSADLIEAYFQRNDEGWFMFFDEEINLSGWPKYGVFMDFSGSVSVDFTRYKPELPLYAANRVHDTINIEHDNRFPLAGNLPDIKQWDFVKACMAMFGLVPAIKAGTLGLYTYDELMGSHEAYDWTAKVDMTSRAPESVSYALNNWAQANLISFQKDAVLDVDPNAVIRVDDTTLSESRNLFELPWAASRLSSAQHYRIKDDGTLEDEDIAARVFKAALGSKGQMLYYDDSMRGEGLIEAHYTPLQNAIRRPLTMSVNIRLHEIDLAQLDLTRPVYLGQYGRYYAILKIQTSETDLCKVELLQLP